ncbi:MAG TPA: GNAT family N-acetyltransferase [Anaeromyxobacter sp.]|nr:GNAT family N-acetyltransferase [Anaeromyxobacter sp.]
MLGELLERISSFSTAEVACAQEVAELAARPGGHPDYLARCAFDDLGLAGYVVYGPTPMTRATYDLYWIATHPRVRGHGLGNVLMSAMEADLRAKGARLVRVETSGTEEYQSTRGFYERWSYRETARIPDFYRDGDDLVILTKRL